MLLLQVVADAGDCAMRVKVWRGAAFWKTDAGCTSSYFSKFFQVLFREQIWREKKVKDTHDGFSVCLVLNNSFERLLHANQEELPQKQCMSDLWR